MTDLPPLDVDPLPCLDLRHLFVLSDDTAILQHASRSTPNLHHGYCTDDTARALIVTVKTMALPDEIWVPAGVGTPNQNDLLVLTQRYLAFLSYAFNEETGRFRNFMHYDRSWLEETGSEDSHARTIWALGKVIRFAPNADIEELADQLMLKALWAAGSFQYIRPWTYTLLGVADYLACKQGQHMAEQLRLTLFDRIYDAWTQHATPDWPWWEDELNWGNAKLPHAMLVGAEALGHEDAREAALTALRWVLEAQTGQAGQLSVIGNNGWFRKGQEMAQFDQQPIEAKALVQACLTAAAATGDAEWVDQAKRCFEWFTGRNDVGASLFNPETGGCHDGLTPSGVNRNQGAESTLAFLVSALALHHYDLTQKGQLPTSSTPDFG